MKKDLKQEIEKNKMEKELDYEYFVETISDKKYNSLEEIEQEIEKERRRCENMTWQDAWDEMVVKVYKKSKGK